jgi:hypothetical protein
MGKESKTNKTFLKEKDMISKYLSITVKFIGVHQWKECNLPEVSFLKYSHRHEFHVTAVLPVTESNRQLEFFIVQQEMANMLYDLYPHEGLIFELGNDSCEMIAEKFVNKFHRKYPELNWVRVQVQEDTENSAGVLWEKDTCL